MRIVLFRAIYLSPLPSVRIHLMAPPRNRSTPPSFRCLGSPSLLLRSRARRGGGDMSRGAADRRARAERRAPDISRSGAPQRRRPRRSRTEGGRSKTARRIQTHTSPIAYIPINVRIGWQIPTIRTGIPRSEQRYQGTYTGMNASGGLWCVPWSIDQKKQRGRSARLMNQERNWERGEDRRKNNGRIWRGDSEAEKRTPRKPQAAGWSGSGRVYSY